ncbi:hypothetical protein ABZ816_01285 [Actinosynnema sp. NPDC047251]|nr:hypothetical protein [Saccharothrix espanaensis]
MRGFAADVLAEVGDTLPSVVVVDVDLPLGPGPAAEVAPRDRLFVRPPVVSRSV